jgi:hypothetical protein
MYELNERRVSVDSVLTELSLLPIECRKEYEELIQQKLPLLEESTRITTLFYRLNPLFTFIDYGLLQHLISNLGSTELQEDMTSYVNAVQVFMRETTVGDVMDHWPGENVPQMNYSELKIKFKEDPRTYTLERLNKFRRKFCSRVRLSEFIFGLISLEPSESFFVIWLIPTVTVARLSMSVHQIEHSFYESECILLISVDEEQLYPPVSASIASPTPVLPLTVPKLIVSLAGAPTPEHTMVEKDESSSTEEDVVSNADTGYETSSVISAASSSSSSSQVRHIG